MTPQRDHQQHTSAGVAPQRAGIAHACQTPRSGRRPIWPHGRDDRTAEAAPGRTVACRLPRSRDPRSRGCLHCSQAVLCDAGAPPEADREHTMQQQGLFPCQLRATSCFSLQSYTGVCTWIVCSQSAALQAAPLSRRVRRDATQLWWQLLDRRHSQPVRAVSSGACAAVGRRHHRRRRSAAPVNHLR